MTNIIYNLLNDIGKNSRNYFSFYENRERIIKSYCDVSEDIDRCIGKLDSLKIDSKIIGIVGPISYQWLVVDLACMKGGYHSVAIPETLNKDKIEQLIIETKCTLLLADYSLKERIDGIQSVYLFNCFDASEEQNFDRIVAEKANITTNRILENYGTAFTSGTSGDYKKINLTFPPITAKKTNLQGQIIRLSDILKYKTSLWGRSDNKLILFMPLSHLQQRGFIIAALRNDTNICISNVPQIIKDIILEKPNIMVSVPVFYQIIANRIREKIARFSSQKKMLFNVYNYLSINSLNRRNCLKYIFDSLLFKEIKKLYGGKADLFIVGSAPVDPNVLQTFYSVGVKIFQAYGQSETSVIAMNTRRNFRIGSVGKPSVPVLISSDSEILIKYSERKYGHNRDVLFIKGGYIHTGDIGYLDKDGYLFVKGRIDDMLVMSNGKKVLPNNIEEKFLRLDEIVQAMVFYSSDQKLSLIIFPSEKLVDREWQHLIKSINDTLQDFERIGNYLIITEPFSESNGLLTSSFKLKRNAIKLQYAKLNYTKVY